MTADRPQSVSLPADSRSVVGGIEQIGHSCVGSAAAVPAPGVWRALGSSLLKVAVIAAATLAWVRVYGYLNARGALPGAAVRFRAPLDRFPGLFQPWMAYIYVVGGYALPAAPYLWNWRAARLCRVLAAYTLGSGVLFAFYWIWPVVIDRPAYDGGRLGEAVLRGVAAVDQPANCFPSAHAFYAAAAAALVVLSARSLAVRACIVLIAAVVVLSTVAVGQHYFMDALAGVAVGLLSVVVAFGPGFRVR